MRGYEKLELELELEGGFEETDPKEQRIRICRFECMYAMQSWMSHARVRLGWMIDLQFRFVSRVVGGRFWELLFEYVDFEFSACGRGEERKGWRAGMEIEGEGGGGRREEGGGR